MIIGNGFIAKGFQKIDREDIIIFASGVSNSKSSDKVQFLREEFVLKKTILENDPHKLLIYFSTYSIDDPSIANSQYVKHKKAMEAVVQLSGKPYLIIRTSNVVGESNNPFTIANYLFNKIVKEERFELWVNATRNLIDIEHLCRMVETILAEKLRNETVYLVCPIDYDIFTIVDVFCTVMGKNALYSKKKKGSFFSCNKSLSTRLFYQLGIPTERYLEILLNRYYNQ
jgi:nucleoside-diphosphate-sugar epimerase